MAPVLIYELIGWKREIFAYYQQALGDLPGIEFMPEAPYGRPNRWLTVILIIPEEFGTDRETIQQALEQENIEARPLWKPMHMQPVFEIEGLRNLGIEELRNLRIKKNYETVKARMRGGEVAEDLFDRGLCLPTGTAMTEEDLDRAISVILSCKK